MSDVSGISTYSTYADIYGTSSTSSSSSTSLTINDFYKLLAAQIQYQDADNPMDTSEMMAQLVQTQMIQAIEQMSQINVISYAASMVGKEVTMAEISATSGNFTGETTSGVVEGVLMGDDPILYVNGNGYYLSQIMTVGTTGSDSDA
jgi:flagellar basal-body rod modification protein FlgD